MENISTLEKEMNASPEVAEVCTDTRKTPFVRSWFRSNITSVAATAVDFMVTIFLTEIAAVWYVLSTALGATAGGVVSFMMCRRWVFNRREARWQYQALRYVLAIGLSLTLNTLSVWFLTETFHISYVISKVIAAAAVGLSVNFLVFRYFVFR